MTEIANAYGGALYSLAQEEDLTDKILQELTVLADSFRQEPDFLRLLSSPALTKQERCDILDTSFHGKVHIYVLNFLKILTEKGYCRHFCQCCSAYQELYNQDHGILPVTAVTAIPLTGEQTQRLTEKLSRITGKTISLVNRTDPSVMGGMRLDYDGKQVDDTVCHRLDNLRQLLKNTVL